MAGKIIGVDIPSEDDKKMMNIVCKGINDLHKQYPGLIRHSCVIMAKDVTIYVDLQVRLANGFARKYNINLDCEWQAARNAILRQLQSMTDVVVPLDAYYM